MATSDGLTSYAAADGSLQGHQRMKEGIGVITATGNLTLTERYANHLKIDPSGSARDVNLPAEATSNGMWFEIVNAADASENLVVKDDGGATIVTISQNEKAKVFCDGSSWYHLGIVTIALS